MILDDKEGIVVSIDTFTIKTSISEGETRDLDKSLVIVSKKNSSISEIEDSSMGFSSWFVKTILGP